MRGGQQDYGREVGEWACHDGLLGRWEGRMTGGVVGGRKPFMNGRCLGNELVGGVRNVLPGLGAEAQRELMDGFDAVSRKGTA